MGDPGPEPGEDDPRALPAWECGEILAKSSCAADETLAFGWDADEVVDLEPLRGIRRLGGTLDLNGRIDAPEGVASWSGRVDLSDMCAFEDTDALAGHPHLRSLWLENLPALETLGPLAGLHEF